MKRPRRDHKATTKRHLIETASAARRWGRGAWKRRVAGRGRRRGHMGGTQASSPRVDQRKSYIGRGMEGSGGRPAGRPWVGEAGWPFDRLRANGIYVGRAGSGLSRGGHPSVWPTASHLPLQRRMVWERPFVDVWYMLRSSQKLTLTVEQGWRPAAPRTSMP